MLAGTDLTKRFGSLSATDNVTVEFRTEGRENVFIVGPNGAGKTTLVNLLTGYLEPDEGTVVLDGDDITGLSAAERVDAGLVRSFQMVQVFEQMSVRENLRTAVLSRMDLTRSAFSLKDEHEAVESDVNELVGQFELSEAEHTLAEELPHGRRKLLDVAMTFGLAPDYLILDEPTAGVSTREKRNVIETIMTVSEEKGTTTITIEHDMEIVTNYADRVIALHQGSVLQQGPPDILETDDDLRRILLGVSE
jgi:branched-chain amino acid transport system ATP-binding protein